MSFFIDKWLETMKSIVKESTYRHYLFLVVKHIKPAIGDFILSDFTTFRLNNYINYLLVSGRLDKKGGLSAKTVYDILSIVKSILKFSEDIGYSINCKLEKVKVKPKTKDIRILSEAEQKVLTDYLLSDLNNKMLGDILSLFTGIRIGELCALQWSDIDLEHNLLFVRKTLQRISTETESSTHTKIIIDVPKSKSSVMRIPLPTSLATLIKPFKCNPEIFFLSGSIKYIEPRTMQNYFKKYLNECEIEDANFHCLRHTFATRCVEKGSDIKSLSEILGHSSVNITLSRYVHSSLELKIQNMEKLKIEF